jgi:hypothetical protein
MYMFGLFAARFEKLSLIIQHDMVVDPLLQWEHSINYTFSHVTRELLFICLWYLKLVDQIKY